MVVVVALVVVVFVVVVIIVLLFLGTEVIIIPQETERINACAKRLNLEL